MRKIVILLVLIVLIFFGIYFLINNKNTVLTQTSTTPTISVKKEPTRDQITQALSQKNNWDTSQLEVNITSVMGKYAKGDVKFTDEMGGGLWFAAKVNDTWKIVYDGNGIITCDQLADYQNFPKELIPNCYDSQSEKLLTR